MGFFDDLANNVALWGDVQASKDENGKPDPYKAAGIAAGMGKFSLSDRARFGTILGSQSAFDTNTDGDYSADFGYGSIDNSWSDFCEDGDEYGVVLEDYDSEEEYEEALTEALFRKELDKAAGQWKEINRLTSCMITGCKSYEECESMKCFRDKLQPIVKAVDIGMVQDEIAEWEKEIAEYINRVEDNDKYEAWKEKHEEIRKQRWEERLQRQRVKLAQTQDYVDDKTIYTYCGVLLPFSNRAFSYRIEDDTIQIGDVVIVPVGRGNEEMEGKVVSVGKYARAGVPYPVEKTKYILKKI